MLYRLKNFIVALALLVVLLLGSAYYRSQSEFCQKHPVSPTVNAAQRVKTQMQWGVASLAPGVLVFLSVIVGIRWFMSRPQGTTAEADFERLTGGFSPEEYSEVIRNQEAQRRAKSGAGEGSGEDGGGGAGEGGSSPQKEAC